MNALFLHDPADLYAPIPGGVQRCTQEFLDIVRAAADHTVVHAVSPARTIGLRLRRRLRLGSYLGYNPEADGQAIAAIITQERIDHVFINRAELVRYAPVIRQIAPAAKLILMSHGNQTGDDLYEVTGAGGRRRSGFARLASIWQMGLDLATESWHRRHCLDAVCVMSAEEEILERWLGATCTVILPRRLESSPLDWKPHAGRIGYVGTLDHTPNRLSLEAICRELMRTGSAQEIELRLVGGPVTAGEALAAEFPFVNYLGRMDDTTLASEAATWSVFLNPVLWLSRGASMKLAGALAWGLPVLSTRSGARGYEWGGAALPVTADRADAFVHQLQQLLNNPTALATARSGSLQAVAAAPDTRTLADRLRRSLAPSG